MIARLLFAFVAIVVIAAVVTGLGLALYGARWVLWAVMQLVGP